MDYDLTLGLAGRVAIVTGAAGDIGRKTVELLAARGVNVVAEDVRPGVTDLAVPGRVVTLVGDVPLEETARRAAALAVERFGTLDVLVNNAGRTLNKPLVDTTADDWDGIMAVNGRGTFLHTRAALRVMLGHGRGGSIVNVASIASVVGLVQTAA